MVVARQILLIFNWSHLPCSVQFVNKNNCQAKNDLFTTSWGHYFVREWCIVSLEDVLMNTPSSQKPSMVLTLKVRWARSENGCVWKTVGNFYKQNICTWSYYPEASSCKSSCAAEIGDPVDFVVCLSCVIAKDCNYMSSAKDAYLGWIGKKPW